MKIIKFFLASSIVEFAAERQSLKAFISRLNDVYIRRDIYFELVLCENLSNAIQQLGSQEMYNRKICECDYFYILVGKELGEYTFQEYQVALNHFNEHNKPNIYPFFLKIEDETTISASVLNFIEILDKELKHYYSHFSEFDSVKLNILLELIANPEISGYVSFKHGQAVIDNQPVLDLDQIPAYKSNVIISELLHKKKELDYEFARLTQEIKTSNDPAVYTKWLDISHSKEETTNTLYQYEKEMLSLFSNVVKLKNEKRKLSWREERACNLIENGDTETAIVLLKDSARSNELSSAEAMIDIGLTNIQVYISENRLLLNTLRTSAPPNEVLPELIKYYEENLALERKYHIDPKCYTDYIVFLDYQKEYIQAVRLCEELTLKYDIDSMDDSIHLYTCIGLIYAKSHQYEQAEKYLSKAYDASLLIKDKDSQTYANCCNNLAFLISDNPNEYKRAESLYKECIETIDATSNILEKEDNKECIAPYLNLAVLYKTHNENESAEKYYLMALQLAEKFYDEEPVYYLPQICTIWNNLGNLYNDINNQPKAIEFFEMAITKMECLAKFNSDAFMPELARIYNNYALAIRWQDKDRATDMYNKALKIRKKLIKKDFDTYAADYAQTVNNLATHLSFYQKGKSTEIEKFFKEALKIRKQLDERIYLSHMAQTHQDFANYYSFIHNYREAEKHFKLAIELFQKESEHNGVALYWKARALIDYGAFLYNLFGDKKINEVILVFEEARFLLDTFDVTKEPYSSTYLVLLRNIETVNSSAY